MISRGPEPAQTAQGKKIAALEAAYKAGVLSEVEYHSKVTEITGAPVQTGPQQQVCAGVEWKRYQGAWRTIARYDEYKEALKAVKRDEFGRYRWSPRPGKPGDRRFICNEHDGCEHALRIRESSPGVHLVQSHNIIAHSGVPNPKKRKNSTMTWEQEQSARKAVSDGTPQTAPESIVSCDIIAFHTVSYTATTTHLLGSQRITSYHIVSPSYLCLCRENASRDPR